MVKSDGFSKKGWTCHICQNAKNKEDRIDYQEESSLELNKDVNKTKNRVANDKNSVPNKKKKIWIQIEEQEKKKTCFVLLLSNRSKI